MALLTIRQKQKALVALGLVITLPLWGPIWLLSRWVKRKDYRPVVKRQATLEEQLRALEPTPEALARARVQIDALVEEARAQKVRDEASPETPQ